MQCESTNLLNQAPPRVPGYTIAEKLGSGSYASVYRALANKENSDSVRETVAIKCIYRQRIVSHKHAVDNLISEIRILKSLRHRHIVALKAFEWDAVFINLIMEYCAGGDLSRFLKSQPQCKVSEETAKYFMQQLAAALNYLHTRDIAHMDLKPQNILLAYKNPPYVLKLADFGFAALVKDFRDSNMMRGSPLYMAPEMFTGQNYDSRIDMWSVGVILYECVFGKAPFSTSSMDSLMADLRSHRPVAIPPGISPVCTDVLHRLLKREPTQRSTFHEFFEHPFIDLKHAPLQETLERGLEIVRQAERAEASQNFSVAVQLYTEALEYLIPGVRSLESKTAAESMRKRLQQYLDRAEALKLMYRDGRGSDNSTESVKAVPLSTASLRDLWKDVPAVGAALTLVENSDPVTDIDKYYLAIDSVLKVIREQSNAHGVRVQALSSVVTGWIDTVDTATNSTSAEESER